MASYDMNSDGEESLYVRILKKNRDAKSGNHPTFKLKEYAGKNNLGELLRILGDVDIYFDINNDGEISGLEIVTFYDEE